MTWDCYEHIAKVVDHIDIESYMDRVLEQVPCEDCISRQAVLNLPRKTLKNYFGDVVAEVIYVRDIMELPPITLQQTKRIPVNERLPENE